MQPKNGPLRELAQRIDTRAARICVVGLGYVGLPEAVLFAQAGFTVTGFDCNVERVDRINAGQSYIADVPSKVLGPLVADGRLQAGCLAGAGAASAGRSRPRLAAQDCLCICVPTPLRKTRDPDVSFIVSAVQAIREELRPGQLIVLESTTYPGTTEEVLQPQLESTGLRTGRDFCLAFSPERVNPGDLAHPVASIPRVVGGVSPYCTEMVHALYGQIVPEVRRVSSPKAAEMVKLLENTFRSVNIGLVNELALMCHTFRLDVWEIIEAAASKPFGFMPFYPGPGLGGHCIPIDPLYLSWKARSNGFAARFIELADQINGHMPQHVVRRIGDALNTKQKSISGSTILVVGVAYKSNVSDTRESPALEIMHLLAERGAKLSYTDPYVPELAVDGVLRKSRRLTPGLLAEQDCVVILTQHGAVDYRLIADTAHLVMDTRNALGDLHGTAEVVKL
jgi:UDP-N-acetyl-D-glucosamine dehydrogenase